MTAAPVRAAVARCLAERGLTQRKAAQLLKRSPALVGYHARALLEQGVLAVVTGGERGQHTTYARGDRWALFEASLKSDKEAERRVRSAHRTIAVAHRGHRAFPVLVAPTAPETAPTWAKEWPARGVRNHLFRHTDADGRAWSFRYSQGKGSRSVTAYPPHVTLTDSAAVQGIPSWWEGFVEKEAHRWSNVAGFTLASRQGKKSAPVEVAVHTPQLPKFGSPGIDTAVVDGTPWKDGSLEGQPAMVASFMRGPDTEARVGAVERRVATCDALFDRLVAVSDRLTGLHEKTARVLAGSLEQAVPMAPAVAAFNGEGFA